MPETKSSKTTPVPADAKWGMEADKMFYEASLESGDEVQYHVGDDDGLYYLGAYVTADDNEKPGE